MSTDRRLDSDARRTRGDGSLGLDCERLFSRIAQLFDVGMLGEARVLVAGCGSGGGQVALQLAMSGVGNFDLYDEDALEIENIIRHVCGLRYVGQRKVDALADLLLDRNPSLKITKHDVNLVASPDLAGEIRKSSVVVLATDNEPSRYHINKLCVEAQRPFVVGRVFTRGIGGEVFRYVPGRSGCLACLEGLLERTKYREGIHEVDLASEEEREKMYGMEIPEIKDSPGLNVNIAFIASFHTSFVLDAIGHGLQRTAEVYDADRLRLHRLGKSASAPVYEAVRASTHYDPSSGKLFGLRRR